MNRITRVLVVSALAATTLSACADDGGHDMNDMNPMGNATPAATSPSRTPGTGAHNEADIGFASLMIPHHRQAVEMAQLVPSRSHNEKVRQLATQIQAAQGPEISQMSTWLESWGAPVPPASEMQHGDGMMSMDEMSRLEAASAEQFDRLWLELMIKHHEGAIAMARTELTRGSDGGAQTLAQAIIDGQSAEIATMRGMLGDR